MKKEVARVNLWLYYVSIEYIILRESPELNIIFITAKQIDRSSSQNRVQGVFLIIVAPLSIGSKYGGTAVAPKSQENATVGVKTSYAAMKWRGRHKCDVMMLY